RRTALFRRSQRGRDRAGHGRGQAHDLPRMGVRQGLAAHQHAALMDADELQRWRRVRDAFDELLDLPVAERAARLDEIQRDDAQLARDLRDLLADTELDPETADPPDDAPDQRKGTVISDRFRLLRLLGIGGMGEVHLAERTDELDRKVALKLVRNDLPISIERARREQQILARLNHPHIAGLLDAGITDAGQPWFAMEYVDGERITD